jgi:hypothetical protein
VSSENLSQDIPQKNNRELLAYRHKLLLKSLVTQSVANIASLLSLARAPETEAATGLIVTTRVHDVKVFSKGRCTLIRMHSSTETSGEQAKQKSVENIVYIFRGFSAAPFEPFICIAKDNTNQYVFAYADDEEFLMEDVAGDDGAIIQQIKAKAKEKGMRSLLRFVDLMMQIIELQKMERR